MIDDELQKKIVEAYVTAREEEKKDVGDSRKSYTTPRQLLALIRLSQAHARCRFSDVEEAMRLTKASKESVEISAQIDKNANPLDVVYDIISDLGRRESSAEGWVEVA